MFAVGAIVAAALVRPARGLLFNATASAPRGWYLLVPARALEPHEYIVIDLPPEVRRFAAERGYLPPRVPLLKQVSATAGTHVCVRENLLFVNYVQVVSIRSHDGRWRPMQKWDGCRFLRAGEILVLSAHSDASFDSRYFGPLNLESVRGKAIPLWTWEQP